MKRSFVILAGLLALGLSSQARGQAVPTPGPNYTKVGVVNMGQVYSKYARVQTFKAEMEKDAEPFKKKKAEPHKYIEDWTRALQNPKAGLTKEQMEMGPKIILDCKRKLEDLDAEFKKEFAKKLEGQMTILNKEINERISQFAGSHGYHLILAFGEPEVALVPLMAFRRTMTVIDSGGMTVAYYAPGISIFPMRSSTV